MLLIDCSRTLLGEKKPNKLELKTTAQQCPKRAAASILLSAAAQGLGRACAALGNNAGAWANFSLASQLTRCTDVEPQKLAHVFLAANLTQCGILPQAGKSPTTPYAAPFIVRRERFPEVPVRTIHHLAATGGTIICKCLAAMANVVLLSEINPCSQFPANHFNPLDPLIQFIKRHATSTENEIIIYRELFLNRMDKIMKHCRDSGSHLIVRDHAHSDYMSPNVLIRQSLVQFGSLLGPLRPLVTLRNPIDSYMSLRHNNFSSDISSFDHYCERILDFLEDYNSSPVFLYEDFVAKPDETLSQMCLYYGIPFSADYKEKFYNITLTGDSGRGKIFTKISQLPRRSLYPMYRDEIAGSYFFRILGERFPYRFE